MNLSKPTGYSISAAKATSPRNHGRTPGFQDRQASDRRRSPFAPVKETGQAPEPDLASLWVDRSLGGKGGDLPAAAVDFQEAAKAAEQSKIPETAGREAVEVMESEFLETARV